MTANHDLERRIADYYETEAPSRAPDWVLEGILASVDSTPQRRAVLGLPWRLPPMLSHAKLAVAAAAIVAVGLVGLSVLPGTMVGPAATPFPSATPSSSPAPLAPTSGAIDPGRYRWTSPGGDVTFVVPQGWTATADGIVRNRETPTHLELARYMPGSPNEVTHVYADACKSEGRLEPVSASAMPSALEAQAGTEAGTSWFGGLGRPGDPPAGLMVEIREEPGLDRSECRYGSEGPLQIWADPAETTFFALPPGHRGMAYVFERDGTTFVFTADIGPEATEADEDSVHAIVGSFEFFPSAAARSPLPGHTRFTSTVHGISIDYPSGWQTRPAAASWQGGPVTFDSPDADVIFDPTLGQDLFLSLVSAPNSDLDHSDAFMATGICSEATGGNFGSFEVDGADGSAMNCGGAGRSGHAVAAGTASRTYVIQVHVGEGLDRYDSTWFEALVATVDLAETP